MKHSWPDSEAIKCRIPIEMVLDSVLDFWGIESSSPGCSRFHSSATLTLQPNVDSISANTAFAGATYARFDPGLPATMWPSRLPETWSTIQDPESPNTVTSVNFGLRRSPAQNLIRTELLTEFHE